MTVNRVPTALASSPAATDKGRAGTRQSALDLSAVNQTVFRVTAARWHKRILTTIHYNLSQSRSSGASGAFLPDVETPIAFPNKYQVAQCRK